MGGIVQYGLDVANAIVARRLRDAAPAARLLEGVVSATPTQADVSTQLAAPPVVEYGSAVPAAPPNDPVWWPLAQHAVA
eukprot:4877805-Lingulodinium_polyedra.AAC.1